MSELIVQQAENAPVHSSSSANTTPAETALNSVDLPAPGYTTDVSHLTTNETSLLKEQATSNNVQPSLDPAIIALMQPGDVVIQEPDGSVLSVTSSVTASKRKAYEIPAVSWTRRLDDTFDAHKAFQIGTLEALRLAGLGLRMWRYARHERAAGRLPIMDPFNMPKAGPVMGVPLGGIGGGTIGRGWRGDFNRWHLLAGQVHVKKVEADQFSFFVEFDEPPPSTSVRDNIKDRVKHILPTKPRKVATVLDADRNSCSSKMHDWNFGLQGKHSTYHALFPRAWTVYNDIHPDIKVTCQQVSPVIPHNYKESSYPAGVFVYEVTNTGETAANVSIMFSFQNGCGLKRDLATGHFNKSFRVASSRPGEGDIVGISMHHQQYIKVPSHMRSAAATGNSNTAQGPPHPDPVPPSSGVATVDPSPPSESHSSENGHQHHHHHDHRAHLHHNKEFFDDPLTLSIAVKEAPGVKVTWKSRWEPSDRNSSKNLWVDFSEDGELVDHPELEGLPNKHNKYIAGALAAKVRLQPGETREIEFSLAWDCPIARFASGAGYFRRYTRFFGTQGDAAPQIAANALENYQDWIDKIYAWQQPIIDDPNLPDFYKYALFNELYYIVDGGTIWTNGALDGSDPPGHVEHGNYVGKFAYLESHEYLMYNTYDVHFYASFALAMLWPKLELSLQRDIAKATMQEDCETWQLMHCGKWAPRKVKCAVPHDMGNPGEDPWKRVNSYNIQDISRWKDLPCKFVLQVYRDYILTKDMDFLVEMWEVIQPVIDRTAEFDSDGDGIIDNEGFPDQTYDTWNVTGCSAYCGGLWLAALSAAAAIAQIMGKLELQAKYTTMLEKGQATYETKLWNGKYYNYDSSASAHHNSIMADQMAGQWYASACGLPPISPSANVQSALKQVFEYNVKKFAHGKMGAVNGMKPNGSVDTTCLQSAEVWTGTTFAAAAAMMQEGLIEEAFETAKGIIWPTYTKLGFQFQTPEAFDVRGGYRAFAYMRPLCIWSIQWAWMNRNKQELLHSEWNQF